MDKLQELIDWAYAKSREYSARAAGLPQGLEKYMLYDEARSLYRVIAVAEELQNSPVRDDLGKDGSPVGESEKGS